MKFRYLDRVRIKTPFFSGCYGVVVGYHFNVDETHRKTTREYDVLIENGHSADPIPFQAKDLDPV